MIFKIKIDFISGKSEPWEIDFYYNIHCKIEIIVALIGILWLYMCVHIFVLKF